MARTMLGVTIDADRVIHCITILEDGEDDSVFDAMRANLMPGRELLLIPLASLPAHPLTGLPDDRMSALVKMAEHNLVAP